ncbi:MAG: preprotein translocase subunit SecG [Alphaproteobacteria bacterium]|nr:preprotein translocase subunit SecG [Alphaproteobacteria bacterium]
MDAVVLVIHLIVALSIIAIVLIQPSEVGGFLGSSGSMSNLMAARRSGDVLTRITTILAGIFFLTSLTLAIIAEHHSAATKSILDVPTGQPAAEQTTAPAAPDTTTATAPDDAALKTVPAPAAQKEKTVAPKKGKPAAPISK